MPAVTWDSKLATVAGRPAPKIEKAFGFRTVGDLLRHYPRRWVEKGDLSIGESYQLDEHVTVVGRIVEAKPVQYADRRRGGVAYRLEVVVETRGNRLALTFFDKSKHLAEWRVKTMRVGALGMFSGKIGRFRDKWQLTNPETRIVAEPPGEQARPRLRLVKEGEPPRTSGTDAAGDPVEQAWEQIPGLLAIYPATSTVQSWQLADVIGVALDLVTDVPDIVPQEVLAQRGLVDGLQALRWIHRPDTWQQQGAAAKRLRFEEAFVTQTVLAQRRAALQALDARPRTGREGGLLDRFDARLPFTLTAGQEKVSGEILADLTAGHPMHRLLQGEVGSGKTVVALRAMLRVVDSGGQAALLAPTEVLAQQHHRSITAMLGDLAAGGMLGGAADGTQVALLTGSLNTATRREALLDAASGQAGIVIGTHALLEERVQFADLGLVVVDEQHRFGVEQRAALTAKSATEGPPHVLVMTATPIPRTVAMTVFGDLETSTLTELPAGRAPIRTNVVPTSQHPSWLPRAFERIREEVEKGHQVYVVCARIGDDAKQSANGPDDTDDTDGTAAAPDEPDEKRVLAGVEQVAPMLAAGPLRGLAVEMLHGRMSPDRKDEVMRGFAEGRVDVLVSTTVIEVGVDVANATMMVVLDADRFGVSQLHQLRGRVGRGGHPGLCLLVAPAAPGSKARERIDAVAGTLDGFELSRVDLEQRREGDVLGTSQSGRRSSLRLLSVLRHEDDIRDARESASALVARDPDLVDHPTLAGEVRRLVESEQADYLEKA